MMAVVFVLLAPLFWLLTEYRPAQPPDGYENADLYQQAYPAYHYAYGNLKQGTIPLWTNEQLCGAPFHAHGGVGLWQPLNAVFLALPTHRAMAVHAYLSLALMGLGMALFLRVLGASYQAALFAGVAFAFSGAAAGVMSRPAEAAALAWAPWAFWMAAVYLRDFRTSAAVLLGMFVALMILAGAVWLAVGYTALLALYALYGAAAPFHPDAPSLPRRFAPLALAFLLAMALSAVQWLPMVEHWRAFASDPSTLWNVQSAALKPARTPDLLRQFLMATPAGVPRLAYIGIATLPFIAVGFLHRQAKRTAWFFAIMIALTWGLWAVWPVRPGSEVIWVTAAYCGLIGVVSLGALGFDRVFTPMDRHSAASAAGPLSLVALGALVLFVVAPGAARGYLIVVMIFVLIFGLIRTPWAATFSGTLIIILLFVDLSVANVNRYRHPFMNAPTHYDHYASTIETGRDQAAGARAVVSADPIQSALPANAGYLTAMRFAGGSGLPLTPEQRQWWQTLSGGDARRGDPADAGAITADAAHPALLRFMSVRVILASGEGSLADRPVFRDGLAAHPVRTGDDGYVYVVDDALPRAYWTPAIQRATDSGEAMDLLTNPSFDGDRVCVLSEGSSLDEAPEAMVLAIDVEKRGIPSLSRADATCVLADPSPERVTVQVEAPADGMLVLSDTYAPGWTVSVDGHQQRIYRVNLLFRGVALPAGPHEVVFQYRPRSFYAGMATTGGSLILLLLGAIAIFTAKAMRRERDGG
jgi:hypothetical protein